MAFPSIASSTTADSGANVTSLNVSYPASIAAGDLLLLLVSFDGAGDVATATGFTEIGNARHSAAADNGAGYWFARDADGTESGTVTASITGGIEWMTATMIRIPAASWFGTVATGVEIAVLANPAASNANPNPPSLSPAWGSADTLWIASATWDGTPTYTSSPASFTALNDVDPANSGGASLATAWRQNATATEDPGTFTISASEQWAAFTIAVRPAAAGGGVSVTPSTLALILATFAPTVTVSDHKSVTPTTRALTLATFAPTVTASDHKSVTPAAATLATATFAPAVSVSSGANVTVTPTTASLALTAFAPNVVATDHKLVTPTTRALALTAFAPTVTAAAGVSVTPSPAALSMTAFAPNVVASDHRLVTPTTAALLLAAFAPDVTIGGIVIGGPAPGISGFRPAVRVAAVQPAPLGAVGPHAPTGSGEGLEP